DSDTLRSGRALVAPAPLAASPVTGKASSDGVAAAVGAVAAAAGSDGAASEVVAVPAPLSAPHEVRVNVRARAPSSAITRRIWRPPAGSTAGAAAGEPGSSSRAGSHALRRRPG